MPDGNAGKMRANSSNVHGTDAVKTVAPSTIVLMLTGWGQRLVADGDIPARVDRVLGKPPKMRELREALAACLEARTLGP